MIILTIGYGHSGSSAAFDLLREFFDISIVDSIRTYKTSFLYQSS